MEFHTLPEYRRWALPMYQRLIDIAGATEAEAQTNMPLMLLMLYDTCVDVRAEKRAVRRSGHNPAAEPGGIFRARLPGRCCRPGSGCPLGV